MDDTARRAHGRAPGLWAGPALALLLWTFWRPALEPGGQPFVLAAVAGLGVWMAVWWMTEAVAIPVTSLLPMVVLPLLVGAPFDLGRVTANYANWRVFLFFGGFLIAIAMEACGLHRRVALLTVRAIGTRPWRVVLGFMVAAACLSMWISNTATALMMLPIGKAVADQFPGRPRFATALMLGIAYGASIGGVATPIGTPPNIAFGGIYARLFPAAPAITFADWMAFALPLVLLFLPLAWLVLVWRVDPMFGDASGVLDRQIEDLGPASPAERRVMAVFVATALLWVFRRPLLIGSVALPGWSDWWPVSGINDGVVAVTMGMLLFLLPSGIDDRPLLRWRVVERKMPWGILILFGGGFALADAIGSGGLSAWFGRQLDLPGSPVLLVIGSATLLTFLTEVTSNTATAQVMLPLAAVVATATARVNPLVAMLPVTVASSFAFMLPVATPPNAVVFGSGMVSMRAMLRHGLVLNIIGIVLLSLVVLLLAPVVFGFDPAILPAWAAQ